MGHTTLHATPRHDTAIRAHLALDLARHFRLTPDEAAGMNINLSLVLAPLEQCPIATLPVQAATPRGVTALLQAHEQALTAGNTDGLPRPAASRTAPTPTEWAASLHNVLAATYDMPPDVSLTVHSGLQALLEDLFQTRAPVGLPGHIHAFRAQHQ